MGVVYSPESVRAGEIPQLGSQARAGHYLLNTLFNPESENGIVAGMVYGSTVYDRATVRSDLDILILHGNLQARAAIDALRQQIYCARNKFHVVVEPHVSSVNHRPSIGDPLYVKYLVDVAAQAPNWTRNDPISHIQIKQATPESVRRDATLYVERKAIKFAAISAANDRVDLRNMQRAFELPSSIGRKVTALFELEKDGAALANRSSLADTTLDCFVSAGETDLTESGVKAHSRLVTLDATYTELLDQTMKDGSIAEYTQWLNEAYPLACQDAQTLASAWFEVLYPDYPDES